jgi:CheY-like chemotaxis protein
LEAAGFVVLSAGSGDAALALLDAGEAVDLIVSDFSMPGMDGMALIREAQRRKPGLSAILLTGFVTAGVAETAIGGAISGAFSVLRKPVDGRRLAERAAALIGGRGQSVTLDH